MVNIQFATPTPPSSNTAAAPMASNLVTVQVTVTNVPAALENLSRTIQTNALPMGTLEGNSLQLSTAMGSLTVTLAQNLAFLEKQNLTQQLINLSQAGRPLTLTLQPGSPPTQGTLVIPTLPTASQTAISSASQTTPAPTLPVPQNFAVGANLSAIVLPSLPQAPVETFSAQASPPPSATASTPLSAIPPSPVTPPVAHGLELLQGMPQQQSPPPSPAQTQASAPSQINAALLTAGNEVALHIDAVLPDYGAGSGKLPPLAQNQIFATVAGAGTGGQIILKADDATLFVKSPVSAPEGTSVIATVEAAKSAPLITILQSLDAKFAALPDLMAALSQNYPTLFQQVMAAHVPQPNEALPGAFLFFFSAFKQCNVRDWLGNEAVNRLVDMGKGPLLRSLTKEFSDAGQTAQDPVVGEWRAYPIPLYAQQQFQSLTLYVHKDRDEQNDASEARAADKIRFLIDMNLSKLGSMQLDGFVQPKKMDMILRSEIALPEGLHQELRQSYQNALGAVGFSGALHFQVGRQHWTVMKPPVQKGIVT